MIFNEYFNKTDRNRIIQIRIKMLIPRLNVMNQNDQRVLSKTLPQILFFIFSLNLRMIS